MKITRLYRYAFILCISFLLASCIRYATCGKIPCELIGDAPIRQLTPASQPAQIVFEDPGTIAVFRGSGCAEPAKSGQPKGILAVEQSLDLPRFAGNATVFLSGWYLKYLNGDHHIGGVGTSIYNIRLEDGATGKTLRWRAAGVLLDDNFDDPYTWCYHYTVVAWNPSTLSLVVDHDDGLCSDRPEETRFANYFGAQNTGATTALSSFPSFLQIPGLASGDPIAILPRGFGFRFGYSFAGKCEGISDHHLLQLAYNLDHGELFMEKGKKYQKGLGDTTRGDDSMVNQGYVSWETYAIFKDNKGRRNYTFGEVVSGLAGSEVGVIQPPFSILPKGEGGYGCSADALPIQTKDHEIRMIPYKYAIPVLTGWELSHLCGDAHVEELGVWIREWDYDFNNPGTLHYKLSATHNGFAGRHKINILGIRPTLLRRANPESRQFH